MSQKKACLPIWLEISRWGRLVAVAILLLTGVNGFEHGNGLVETSPYVALAVSVKQENSQSGSMPLVTHLAD